MIKLNKGFDEFFYIEGGRLFMTIRWWSGKIETSMSQRELFGLADYLHSIDAEPEDSVNVYYSGNILPIKDYSEKTKHNQTH